jgi:adenine nucleotide transporter 17
VPAVTPHRARNLFAKCSKRSTFFPYGEERILFNSKFPRKRQCFSYFILSKLMSDFLRSKILESLTHSIAGSIGGVVAGTITHPLATVAMRLQAQAKSDRVDPHSYNGMLHALHTIARQEGRAGLYAGYKSAMFGLAIFQGIYYYWYALFGLLFQGPNNMRELSAIGNLLVASLAGCMTATLTNPIWVVNTQMSVERKNRTSGKGVIQTFLTIVREDGFFALFQGLVPSLVLVINPVIQFVLFERLRLWLTNHRVGRQLNAADFFALGALTKLCATFLTYPLLVVKTRLQLKEHTNTNDPNLRYSGTIDGLRKIWQQEGLAGFYKGVETKLLHSVLTSAILFLVKEKAHALTLYLLFYVVSIYSRSKKSSKLSS